MTQTPTDALRLVPVEPTEAVLTNMAIRFDHGLGCPGYYDSPIFGGPSHARRFEAAKTTMRQLYEEVVLSAAAPASPLPGGGWQDMTCDEQFALATEIAANIGYVLQPEPDHPDCPHARQGLAKILSDQLNDTSRRLRPLPAAPTGEPK